MKTVLLRLVLVATLVAAAAVALGSRSQAGFIQQQRAQRAVYILVNVTPAPIVMRENATQTVALTASLHARGSSENVDAYSVNAPLMLAQNTPQQDVRVLAGVTPNPTATLLTTNQTSVTFALTAGTSQTIPCAYQVTVDTGITLWTLRHGVSNDFASGFPGGDLANNSYNVTSTPNPSATPFVVYPNPWAVLATAGGVQTFCVGLTLSVPSTVPGGAYSTNAVYTLYY